MTTGQETGHLLGSVPSKHLRHGTTSPLSSAQSQLTTNQENSVNTSQPEIPNLALVSAVIDKSLDLEKSREEMTQ